MLFQSDQGGTDGARPQAGIISGSDAGPFFGTTEFGGDSGRGTIYEVVKRGSRYREKVLYGFHGSDGARPIASPTLIKGSLFGTTESGGAHGYGTFYRYGPAGLSTLYAFRGGTNDGASPSGRVVADSAGDFYGVTRSGGIQSCEDYDPHGCGVIYKLIPGKNGYTEQVLYRFLGGTSGSHPESSLLYRDGKLYGTTMYGGARGCGTVFVYPSTSPGATIRYLHSFAKKHGCYPMSDLVTNSSNQLFGTTYAGGEADSGTLYQISY